MNKKELSNPSWWNNVSEYTTCKRDDVNRDLATHMHVAIQYREQPEMRVRIVVGWYVHADNMEMNKHLCTNNRVAAIHSDFHVCLALAYRRALAIGAPHSMLVETMSWAEDRAIDYFLYTDVNPTHSWIGLGNKDDHGPK